MSEFAEYIKTGELDLKRTNELFAKLSVEEQDNWVKHTSNAFMDRLAVISANSINFDYTHIAFSIRLLKEGRLWKSGPYKTLSGKPNECYANCTEMVNDSSMIYMGYGLNKGKKVWDNGFTEPYLIWIPHAWLVLKKGKKILETTPYRRWNAYFGVPVTSEELLYITTKGVPKDTPGAMTLKEFEQAHNANLGWNGRD
jgi:hypothetical protein